jgi:hypothetical protein
MTTKNFNAKKVLMSTIAAVVFSFAFTTSAMAEVSAPTKGNVGVRVKTEQKGNVGVRVKTEQNKFEEFLYQTLGIRVKVRVK